MQFLEEYYFGMKFRRDCLSRLTLDAAELVSRKSCSHHLARDR
jgi:hypothetical protein